MSLTNAMHRIWRLATVATRWRPRWVQHDYGRSLEGVRYEYRSVVRQQAYAPWVTDGDFTAVYSAVRANTLVSVERCYELWDLARNIASVPGDFMEVGVWRGGTGAILASALAHTKPSSTIYLCDTFRGVVKAGARDAVYRGGEHANTSSDLVAALLARLKLGNAQ